MIAIRQYSCVSQQVLETIAALDRAIFPEPISEDGFARELLARHNLCILIAECGAAESGVEGRGTEGSGLVPAGYKIGYECSPEVFYSFSGGVLPKYRRQGIAQALLREQHRIAGKLGYSVIRTHTKNVYRDMLVLNIKSGFDVTGVNCKLGEKFQSIILEKNLRAEQ